MYFCFRNDAHTTGHTRSSHPPLGDASSEGRSFSVSFASQNALAFLLPISATVTIHSDRSTFAWMLWSSDMFSYASRAITSPTPSCWWIFWQKAHRNTPRFTLMYFTGLRPHSSHTLFSFAAITFFSATCEFSSE